MLLRTNGKKSMQFVHLLRTKAEPLPQIDAFRRPLTSTEIISRSFLSRPTAKVPKGATWHIGNTTEFEPNGIFFALGREAAVRSQQFNELTREFEESEENQAPFTVGVYDIETQVTGVLCRPGVSLSPQEIAKKLRILLESAGIAREHNCQISVEVIPDPQEFFHILRSAYKIKSFEFEFSLPNPPDDEIYIQRPLKNFAQKVRARSGKANVHGDSLESDELIKLTRAVAAEGDYASARVEMAPGMKPEKKRLSGNPLKAPLLELAGKNLAENILKAIQKAYTGLRDSNG